METVKTPPKIELKSKVGLKLDDIVTINHLNYKVKKILNRGRVILKKVENGKSE